MTTGAAASRRTLESRKLHLIERLAATKNEVIIQQLEVLLLQEGDWWGELTDEEKADLQEGLADLENGRTETYEPSTPEWIKNSNDCNSLR